MRRFFIEISYNGANYHGWQIQRNASSVQQTLHEVIQRVVRKPIRLVGSSRTDTGVHALRQVAQIDFEPGNLPLVQLKFLINQALPQDIAVLDFYEVKPKVMARFDAISRSYRYIICRHKDPFWYRRSLNLNGELDLKILDEAAEIIKNTVDFEAFSKIHTDVNHFRCQIFQARWQNEGHLLVFEITANRFLRGMVRALVGTMLEMAKGKLDIADFQRIIEQKNRRMAGENAPPWGLYLTSVKYPDWVRQ